MCRYCKNLKRLKDLDEKEYVKIINCWKSRDVLARKLLKEALPTLELYTTVCEKITGKYSLVRSGLVFRIKCFIENNWIGK